MNLPDWLRARFSDAERFMILCSLAGLLCGLAAVLFHFSIHYAFHSLWELALWMDEHGLTLAIPLIPALGALATGWLLEQHAPSASGSGIPQTKAAFYNKFGIIRLKEAAWRFLLGTLFVGTGNALGREGPTVHMCAAIASKIGQGFGLAKARIQGMVPVGMGAGIAAAFNAPLSAILFVFEELLDDFSTKALAGIVVAVVIASTVSRMILGEEPVLSVNLSDNLVTAPWMLVSIPLGIAAGLGGHLFVRLLLLSRGAIAEHIKAPRWLIASIGGLFTGCLATFVWIESGAFGEPQNGIFSIGYHSLEAAFENQLAATVLALLLIGKFLAAWIGYVSGGSGGLFSPTLFIGGMLGGLFGVAIISIDSLGNLFWGIGPEDVAGACVLLGMGAVFASVVRCPFTSLFIIFEMTREYNLILPLMVGNMISYFLARKLQPIALYNSLLIQDGVTLRKMPAYQGARDYHSLPVSAIMTHECVSVFAELNSADNLAALERLGRKHHGYPVLDDSQQLCGMIMHHELLEHVEHGLDTPLAELLQKQSVVSVNPDTSIRDAASVLIQKDVLQVPVVSRKNSRKLLGFLTLHDIARQQNAAKELLGR